MQPEKTHSTYSIPTKAKEAPSPHEVRLAPMGTNPVFQCLGGKYVRICEIFDYTQPAFICSKLRIEALEQGVKYVHSLF